MAERTGWRCQNLPAWLCSLCLYSHPSLRRGCCSSGMASQAGRAGRKPQPCLASQLSTKINQSKERARKDVKCGLQEPENKVKMPAGTQDIGLRGGGCCSPPHLAALPVRVSLAGKTLPRSLPLQLWSREVLFSPTTGTAAILGFCPYIATPIILAS